MTRLVVRSGDGLSEKLAFLDLGSVDATDLATIASDEALRLLGGHEAVVWVYRSALGRLFYQRLGAEPASVTLTDAATAELLAGPATWSPDSDGVRGRLIEASFGLVARRREEVVLAVPLTLDRELLGLALVARDPQAGGDEAKDSIGGFARQTAIALLNHRQLQRARQNEDQLQALFETASELTSNLDLEAVLTAIVERARTVVGAPISYIMLVDDRGEEIAMRVTSGTVDPGFPRLKLKLGGGLGGQVAAHRRALYTSDYLGDVRFEHVPEVDGAVRNEGVRSILGAPMNLSERFVGVLFVADRAVRAFSDAEVGLVTTLANHAATAIHNAELYERARCALRELAETHAVVEAQNQRLQRADQLYAQLSQAVLAGRGLSEIGHLIAAVIGGNVLVFDHHHQVLAHAGEPADAFGHRLVREGLVRTCRRLPELQGFFAGGAAETVTLAPSGVERTIVRLVVPLIARGELLGSVWLELPAGDIAEARPLIEQASRVVALELLKERAVAEVHRRLGRELLDDLLHPHVSLDEGLARRAAELGVDLSEAHRIVRAEFAPRELIDDSSLVGLARDAAIATLRRQKWCRFAGSYGQGAVALVDPLHPEIIASVSDSLEHAMADLARVRAAISPPCERVEDYRPNFNAAGRALELAGGQRSVAVVDLAESWVLTLLFRGDREDLQRFVNTQLGPLLAHDEQHGLGLVETLESYLDSEHSPTRTAAALHVHVNTVYYRLDRLKAVMGGNFADSRRALDLRVALLAYRYLIQSRNR